VLLRLLGEEFAGILGNDRFSSYLKYLKKNLKVLMQFCWAHFKRNLLGAQETAQSRRAQRFCREALSLQRRLFRLWYRFRGGVSVRGSPLTRQQLIKKSIPLQEKFFALGRRYLHCDDTLRSWVAHYNKGRPHSSVGPGIPEKSSDSAIPRPKTHGHRLPRDCEIRAKDVLGGLHHEYWLEQSAA